MQSLEWDNDNCIMAIEAYKKHRVLWDPKHPGYFMKNRKHEAWNAMAAELNIDMEEVKKKMNSLLGSYRRERSRIKQSMMGNKGVYKSKWFAIESFSFLSDRDDLKNGFDSFSYDEFQEMQSAYFLQDSQQYEDIKQEPHSPIPGVSPNPQVDIIEQNENPFKRKRISNDADNIYRNYSQMIYPDSTAYEEDEYNSFGLFIAAKLRKMSPLQRLCAEHIINEALFNGTLEKLKPISVIYTPSDGQEIGINTGEGNTQFEIDVDINENQSESNENPTESNESQVELNENQTESVEENKNVDD